MRSRVRTLLTPHIVIDHVSDLDPEMLARLGKHHVLVDLDNTLLAWGSDALDLEVRQWVEACVTAGLGVCILSNSHSLRVAEYAAQLGVPFVGTALKPSRAAAVAAMQLLGSTRASTAIVGDQIFTDILLGNRLGLYTVLVRPLAVREQLWMRLVRRLERRFWPLSHPRRSTPEARGGEVAPEG